MGILHATMEVIHLTIANNHAPYSASPEFFHEVCNVIKNVGNSNVIIGGDFNQVRDLCMDNTSRPNLHSMLSILAIDQLSEELGLIDPWRLLHPNNND